MYLTAEVKGKLTVIESHTSQPSLRPNVASDSPEQEIVKVMLYRKVLSLAAALLLAVSTFGVSSAKVNINNENEQASLQSIEPLNIAILIQDDLVAQVGNELGVTRDFIRSLPEGSRVMIGYIRSGSLQVRQPFTTDREKAAKSLRIPTATTASSPFNPYVEVIEALKKFESNWTGANAVLLISDGLDTSRGFDSTAAGQTIDLERAIKEANKRRVSIFSFYAPTVGLTSSSRLAASYGQSSLNKISNRTGGRAFFQGTTGFVTFDSHFARLTETLNRQYARAR
jgi:hypothetical protein